MNPNGQAPTPVDGDFVLWEANSIMHCLVQSWAKRSGLAARLLDELDAV